MNIRAYTIDHASLDWASLLSEWRWLVPLEARVIMLTATGDIFVALPDEAVWRLEIGGGEFAKIASSQSEFDARLRDPSLAADWLLTPVVDDLVASGCVLRSGTCYSYRMLPILGGGYSAQERAVLPIREHFGAWGSLHRQIAGMPDGSKIKISVVE